MIAVIDYDAGNIKSVEKALLFLGENVAVTRDRDVILRADGVILPGVGAFGDAMEKLRAFGLAEVIRECADRGIPLLGICLGLQLLFESSEESPGAADYGVTIHASVEKGNVFACQFHPEKSSDVGLQILRNFIKVTKE